MLWTKGFQFAEVIVTRRSIFTRSRRCRSTRINTGMCTLHNEADQKRQLWLTTALFFFLFVCLCVCVCVCVCRFSFPLFICLLFVFLSASSQMLHSQLNPTTGKVEWVMKNEDYIGEDVARSASCLTIVQCAISFNCCQSLVFLTLNVSKNKK